MNKIFKRIGYAIVAVVVAKFVGGYMGKEAAKANAQPTYSATAPKTTEQAYVEGQKVMEAAFNKPPSEFCRQQGEQQTTTLEKTINITDHALIAGLIGQSCTGGQDMALKMREWGMTNAQIRTSADETSSFIPTYKARFEAEGMDSQTATEMARAFVSAMQTGYTVELAR